MQYNISVIYLLYKLILKKIKMKNSIKNLNRYSVEYSYSKNESETNTFATLEEAEKAYNDIAC